MTYKEKLMQEHPEEVDRRYRGGCYGCPVDYGYEQRAPRFMCGYPGTFSEDRCKKCWNREMGGES